MSFSGGVFSINTSGQPVVDGTTISASVFNALTADLATGLSTCMLKDGTQTATAGIGFYAGTVSLPGIYFGTDTTTGLYRIGLNNNGYSVAGTKVWDIVAASTTLSHNLLFTDATYDIGASGATRPRNIFLSGNATIGGTVAVTGNITFTGDLAVNGGDLTTTATTFNLINATATTVNFAGGASTALNVGNASGTNTILGASTFSQAVTLSAALTYGGVTLSNAVTGTGNMVLSASPTFTGTVNAAAITASGQFLLSNTGPHAFGGSALPSTQFLFEGSFSPGSSAIGLGLSNTLTPSVGGDAYGMALGANLGAGATAITINKAGSGTHDTFSTLQLYPPTIGAGASTLTNAATLKINGAPSTGSNQYALWVTSGAINLGSGTLTAGATSVTTLAASGLITGNATGLNSIVGALKAASSGGDGITLGYANSTDTYDIGVNYTNINGTESVNASSRPSWRTRANNPAGSATYTIAYRADGAGAGVFSDVLVINPTGINGVLGGTTPAAASVTTLAASGITTLTADASTREALVMKGRSDNSGRINFKSNDLASTYGVLYWASDQISILNSALTTGVTITPSTGAFSATGTISANGGTIDTDDTTFNLINATATTVNFAGGASTALNIGNASGTNTVNGVTNFAHGIKLAGGDTLTVYDEGTWTPTAAGFTNVGGTPTYAGYYTRVGKLIHVLISITPVTSTASTLSTSTLTLPFNVNGASSDVLASSPAGGVIASGNGYIDGADNLLRTPTWSAGVGSNAVYVSATYLIP